MFFINQTALMEMIVILDRLCTPDNFFKIKFIQAPLLRFQLKN